MNLILLFKDDFLNGTQRVRLTDRRHAHIRTVHRACVGDELCIGICDGQIGKGRVIVLDDRHVEMDITLDRDAPGALPVTLVLALPRPLVCNRVLIAATSMGIKRLILFHCSRVEKSFWKSPVLKEENIKKQLVLGLEQARDTILPHVQLRPLFKPFVEDELPDIARQTMALVAHPQAVEGCPCQVKGPVTLVIGPEGGLSPFELEKLTGVGFRPFHIGERILRVESAIPAVLSKLF